MQKPPENKNITIYDIAREAGVSAATVSRVLTNSANVRKPKRERIEFLIQKYNFKPNALAKSLSNEKNRMIGIIVADIRNPYYAETFVACEDAAKEAGYTVLLCNSHGVLEREIQMLDMLQQQRAAAIIQMGGGADYISIDKEYEKKLSQITNFIPIVCVGNLNVKNCYNVEIDAEKAAELLIEHLVELGHREIAMIGGRRGEIVSTCEKYQTYLALLAKHEIEFKKEYMIDGGYDYSTGYVGMNQLFEKGCIPTAVIAINDYSACGVMCSIVEHGYRIPEDISVVSYDNTFFSDLLTPKLTSIDYDYEFLGKKLVETVLKVIENEEIPQLQKITPSLVSKESSGPCRNQKGRHTYIHLTSGSEAKAHKSNTCPQSCS